MTGFTFEQSILAIAVIVIFGVLLMVKDAKISTLKALNIQLSHNLLDICYDKAQLEEELEATGEKAGNTDED